MIDDYGPLTAPSRGHGQRNMVIMQQGSTGTRQGMLLDLDPSKLNVSESVRIQAEVQRILYALATPEYMEAWLQLPDVERVECHSERRSFNKIRIDLLSPGRRKQSIYLSCLLSKPNKITYLWERDHEGSRERSMVEIHLLGGPTSCILQLKHSGLINQDERERHSTMWRRSLCNLCKLVEGIKTAP